MYLLEEPRPTYKRHRLTVEQYTRMAETGVLAPDARVELIEGEIVEMAPMGTRHYAALARLHRLLDRTVGDLAIVVAQAPIRLAPNNEPEPDLVLLRPRDDFYASALPTAADCLLVIEISDSTLAYDLQVKAPMYARQGVSDYWVLDLPNRTLHHHSQPQPDGWRRVTAARRPGQVALPGLADATVDLSDVLA